MDSLRGRLLIASPGLLDPNFRRTVVLVTEHTDDGAAGLVLNRRSEAEVGEVVPQLVEIAGPEEPIYIGGPVELTAALVVAEFEDPDDAAVRVVDDVGFLAVDVEEPEPPIRRRRVFAGYAGWGAGQLESELEREDWILEPAQSDDVFCDRPDELWADVLRRKGGVFELIARMPEDPSVN